jgi:hypothetical protein
MVWLALAMKWLRDTMLHSRHCSMRYPFFFRHCCGAIISGRHFSLRKLCRLVHRKCRPRYVSASVFLPFALMFLRQRFGGGALVAELASRLGAFSVTTVRARSFGELIMNRVFGQRLIETIAYAIRADMIRMLQVAPLCKFMSDIQVIAFEGM